MTASESAFPQKMDRQNLSRRELLKLSGAAFIAEGVSAALHGCAAVPSNGQTGHTSCAKLTDIQHVVIVLQENRSFDHYFGSYHGVRGFSDASAAFEQPNPTNTSNPPIGKLLPFHLDSSTANGACTQDIAHDWASQHQAWNNGAMDGFVTSKMALNQNAAILSMGYYTRADLAFYYALADAFTICDNYFCSVMGPTDPNRLYTMAASIDPDGTNGGPLVETLVTQRPLFLGALTYTTMPEQLEARGISWKVYSSPESNVLGGILSDNVLPYFKNFQNASSPLNQKGLVPRFPDDFLKDVASGNLPQVSWLIAPLTNSEHPPAPTVLGENTLFLIVNALMAQPALWSQTVLFLSYDENGGFFDHVPPVTPPPGTPGEFVTVPSVPDPNALGVPPIRGPIGLGFRVPMLVVSPFSRGGFVCSDLFDHTSVLRFLETRFGAEVPNLSAWRRSTVGDLTTAFNFKRPDTSIPSLPSAISPLPQQIQACASNPGGITLPSIPDPQSSPSQEPGTAARPSGAC